MLARKNNGTTAVAVLFATLLFVGCKTAKPIVDSGPILADVETFDPSPYQDEEPVFVGDVEHDIPERILDRSLQTQSADRGTRIVPGYRIQVASFSDRPAANQAYQKALSWAQGPDPEEDTTASEAKKQHAVYLEWDQPYWKVRLGDFARRSSAEVVVEEARKEFQGAFIVPATVTLK